MISWVYSFSLASLLCSGLYLISYLQEKKMSTSRLPEGALRCFTSTKCRCGSVANFYDQKRNQYFCSYECWEFKDAVQLHLERMDLDSTREKGPLCERCKIFMLRTYETAQTEGRWRRKDECPQCHVRHWALLDEAEPIATNGPDENGLLRCEVCDKRVVNLHYLPYADKMACAHCKDMAEEDEERSDYYRDQCKDEPC